MTASTMIIPTLYKRQKERGGYLTESDLRAVAEDLGVPLYRIQSLVSFFPHFSAAPPARVEVHVCRDMSCHLRGSVPMTERLQRWASAEHPGAVAVHAVSCLGRCDRAPAAMINERLYVARDEASLREIIQGFMQGAPPPANTDAELAQPKAGTWQMDVYAGKPTYDTIRNYVKNQDAQDKLEDNNPSLDLYWN